MYSSMLFALFALSVRCVAAAPMPLTYDVKEFEPHYNPSSYERDLLFDDDFTILERSEHIYWVGLVVSPRRTNET